LRVGGPVYVFYSVFTIATRNCRVRIDKQTGSERAE